MKSKLNLTAIGLSGVSLLFNAASVATSALTLARLGSGHVEPRGYILAAILMAASGGALIGHVIASLIASRYKTAPEQKDTPAT